MAGYTENRGGRRIKTEIKWLTGGVRIYVCENRLPPGSLV